MKKITLFTMLFITTLAFGQVLPLDFEVPEDNNFAGFNGTVASVVVDPTDATNNVLQLAGNGVDFDGAAMTLTTYVDLSDDATNTITMRMWSPVAATRTHLLKFEGGASGATELFFNTTMMGWQTINIDFGAMLGNQYPTIVIFTDAGGGNTATGTYYIDDITGPNGAAIPGIPTPATAAPDPTAPANQILSVFSSFAPYTNLWTREYNFGQSQLVDLGTPANSTLRLNLAAAGYGEGRQNVFDITAYDFLQFDYWADTNSTEIRFFMIGNAGSVVEYWYQIGGTPAGSQEAIVQGAWKHVEVPLAYFQNSAPRSTGGTGGFTKANFFQWKIDASSNLQSDYVYIDNIYFSQQALSTESVALNAFSAFPNPATDSWTISSANTSIDAVQVYDLTGKLVMDLKGNNTSLFVDGSRLANGMYVAKITAAGAVQNMKLVKE